MGDMDDGFTARDLAQGVLLKRATCALNDCKAADCPEHGWPHKQVVFQHDIKQPCNCKTCQTQHRLDEEAYVTRTALGMNEPITIMPSKEDVEQTRPTLDLTMAANQVNHTLHDPLDRPYVDDHAGEAPDVINHPPHYKRGGLECIDVIEGFELGFRLGNAVKYILRAGHKGDRLEDLKKARWYLDREIEKG